MNTSEILAFAQNGAVATLTLNWPDVRNAFNETVIAELTGVFRTLADKPGVCVIVLTGNGSVFYAGADLNWMKKMTDYSDDENHADTLRLAETLRAIYTRPKPVIARAQGDTYTGGIGLVTVCDAVVAVDTASFCLSEARLGLILAITSPYVIRALDEQASCCYLTTVERFFAAEAHRLGLVYELVSTDAFDAKVADTTAAFVANSPNAVHGSKRLAREVSGAAVNDALLVDTTERIIAIRALEEGHEGVQNFLGKCKSSWPLPA